MYITYKPQKVKNRLKKNRKKHQKTKKPPNYLVGSAISSSSSLELPSTTISGDVGDRGGGDCGGGGGSLLRGDFLEGPPCKSPASRRVLGRAAGVVAGMTPLGLDKSSGFSVPGGGGGGGICDGSDAGADVARDAADGVGGGGAPDVADGVGGGGAPEAAPDAAGGGGGGGAPDLTSCRAPPVDADGAGGCAAATGRAAGGSGGVGQSTGGRGTPSAWSLSCDKTPRTS